MIGHTTAVLQQQNSLKRRFRLKPTGLSSLRIINIVAIQVNIRYEHQEKLMFHLLLFQHLENKRNSLEIWIDFELPFKRDLINPNRSVFLNM